MVMHVLKFNERINILKDEYRGGLIVNNVPIYRRLGGVIRDGSKFSEFINEKLVYIMHLCVPCMSNCNIIDYDHRKYLW